MSLGPLEDLYPLTPLQEGLLYHSLAAPGSTVYVEQMIWTFENVLDVTIFGQAWQQTIDRHPILRTGFLWQETDDPVQVVYREVKLPFQDEDWRDVSPAEQTARLDRLAEAERRRGFDLTRAPLLRLAIARLRDEAYACIWTFHHLLLDGWSVSLLLAEVFGRYRALRQGASLELPAPPPYRSFVAWLQQQDPADAESYWRGAMQGLTAPTELPVKTEGTAVDAGSGEPADHLASIPESTVRALQALGRRERVTLNTIVQGAWALLLSRYSGDEDVVFGATMSIRPPELPSVDGILGLLINTLPVRVQVPPDAMFIPWLKDLQAQQVAARAFAHTSLARIQQWTEIPRGLPLFGTLLVFENYPMDQLSQEVKALGLNVADARNATHPNYPLSVAVMPERQELRFIFDPRQFAATTVERLAGHLGVLLEGIAAEPGRRLSELPLLSEAERHLVVEAWNQTERPYPTDETLVSLIERQVERTPEAVAVSFEGQALTYHELDARANQLAHHLRGLGVGPETLVAICAERSLELVVGLVGILKAGGAYVPLDPGYPADRLAFMLEDAGAPVLLTQRALAGRPPAGGARVVCLDADWPTIAASPASPVASGVGAEHLAYAIYTSGSTGQPKGALNTHRGIVNRLLWMQEAYGLGPADRVLQKTPYSFDVSVWEFFWPLLTGACLVVARPDGHRDPGYLRDLIREQAITTVHFVPSMLQAFLHEPEIERCTSLRRVICSGEALPPAVRDRCLTRLPGAKLENLYGPTEAAVDVTVWSCNDDLGKPTVPIGRPIANTQVYVLDNAFQPVPVGVPGELYLGGVQVARGYLRRPDLTAERFLQDSFSAEPGARLYRTGDRVRWRDDGALEYLGRLDDQVKLRGFRVELGEIETALRAHTGVADTAVVVHEHAPGDVRLAAYIVPDAEVAGPIRALIGLERAGDLAGRRLYELPNGLQVVHANPGETAFLYRELFEDTAYLRNGIALSERACIFDVGANIGLFGVAVAQACPDARVYAFEPFPALADLARLNARLHSVDAQVFECALGASAGQATFTYYPHVSILSGRYADAAEERETVRTFLQASGEDAGVDLDGLLSDRLRAESVVCPIRTLSDVIVEHGVERIDLLKIDVEKSELDVLAGLADADWPKVRQLVVEVHDIDNRVRRVTELLERHGFAVVAEADPVLKGAGLFTLYGRRPAELTSASPPRPRPAVIYGRPAELVSALREDLRDKLPDYMVPTSFTLLEALPLTPNGKLDRRALPEPDAAARPEAGYVAPRTPTEDVLAGIWADVLGVERVGIRDNFFDLGGHSLLATRVLARVRQTLAVDLSLRDVIEGGTVAVLARRVEAARASSLGRDEVPLVATPRAEPPPSSFAQERLWVLDRLEGATPRYTIPGAVRLDGRLDPDALERALRALVERHEALRTTFAERNGRPFQMIAPVLELVPTWRDLRSLSAADREAELARRLGAEALRPFDLEGGPLIRAGVLQLGDEEHVLTLTLHHIVADGWSLDVLWRDLAELYAAEVQGRPAALEPLAVQYADYAVWQRAWLSGERLERQLAYWRERLAGAPTRLELPADRPRPSIQDYHGAAVPVRLGAELTRVLRRVGRENQATLHMVLLAAFQTLLHRYSGQEELLVGVPTAGRSRVELEELVGLFVNTLVLRANLGGDPTFVELLERTREASLDADAHQELPFERLVTELQLERDLSVNPLVQVLFTMQSLSRERSGLPGLAIEPVELAIATTKVDLTLTLQETEDGIVGSLEYDTALFDRQRIERLAGHLGVLLEGIAAEPGRRLSELPLLSEAERHLVVEAWNQTERPYPTDETLVSLIERQVERTPEAVAVSFEGQALTYHELDARANQLAHHLRGLGVGPETLVAICAERSLELVVGLVGILKAGGAYVPLDPGYPADRLAFMLEDAGAPVLLTQRALAGRPPAGGARVVCLDADWPTIAASPASPVASGVGAEHLAYAIYTSGSTGQPKGALNTHRGIVNRLLWMQEAYGLGPADRVLQKTPYSFDVSVWEFFWPLLTGACLVVARPDGHRDPGYLRDLIREQAITTVHFVPSMLQAFLHEPEIERCTSLRRVICSGEALPPAVRDRCLTRLPGAKLENLYGPTEAAVDVTVWSCNDDLGKPTVPIGRPIANTQVYVLDPHLQAVPIGVPGELHIGGVQVGRGYLRRPDLTAERFVPDPFSSDPTARLYKTGDRVRWRDDGALEYLGRLDDQVKLRGFRIEPGEIESALAQHPAIREAVVVAREDRPGDPWLVAYLVGADGQLPGVTDLRGFLSERLPDYMVPAAFVALDTLPLSPSGKLDRRALPAPEIARPDLADEYVAPRNPTEALLAEIWSRLLDIDDVGIYDSFFDLGGDSILAMQVVARARQAGLQIQPTHVFQHQTIAELAPVVGVATPTEAPPETTGPLVELDGRQLQHVLAQLGAATGQPVDQEALEDVYPLGSLQQGLLYHSLAAPGSTMYVEQLAWTFSGTLDPEAYRQAWQGAIDRHAILRTGFVWQGLESPVQAVLCRATLPFRTEDWCGFDEAEQRVLLSGLRDRERREGFDLATAPLMRLVIVRLSDDAWVCVWTFHHLLMDGWSVALLLAEVFGRYRAARTGAAPELAAAAPYRDFIAWLQRQDPAQAERFWRGALRGLTTPTTLPVGSVEAGLADVAREPADHLTWVPEQTLEALQALARHERLTLNTIVQGAWALLLARYCGEDDVVFGATTSVRPPGLPDVEGMLGLLINTLPVRVQVPKDATLIPWLQALQTQQAEARNHAYSPLTDIHGWSDIPRGESLFESLLIFENFPLDAASQAADSLDLIIGDGGYTTHPDLPLNLMVQPGTRLALRFLYDPGRFDAATVERLAGHLGVLLEGIAAEPGRRLSELPLLSEAERHLVVEAWNQTAMEYEPERTVPVRVEEQARRNPDALAVTAGVRRLRYGELNQRANQLAHELRARGVGPGGIVGVLAGRSPELVVALLGVMKAGAAYLPLDPAYPAERLAFMLDDAGAAALVTDGGLEALVPDDGRPLIRLDRDGPLLAGRPTGDLDPQVGAADLAYVIYTSGSTGRPKAVAIPHRGLANLVGWHVREYQVTPADRATQLAGLAFDASVWELWPYLSVGASVHFPDEATRADVAALVRWLAAEAITLTFLPTPLAELAVEEPWPTDGVLRALLTGGDRLHRAPGRALPFTLVNHYGPTENSVVSTAIPVPSGGDGDGAPPPIGRPIANTRTYVLDPQRRPTPIGVPGELYVGGESLARGYLHRPELTAELFVADPFASDPDGRLYRTGDLVRWRADGAIEFLGRIDEQVKVRGFRIEPGEIEAALLAHPGVAEAAVVARGDGAERRLAGYVVPTGAGATAADLRAFLSRRLPNYMVPSSFTPLEALPLTPNGKLDRRALPEPDAAARPEAGYVAPRTPTEDVLAGIWADVLGVERVGIRDNFFDLGGHSLLATRVLARVRQTLAVDLSLRDVIEGGTVAVLARRVEAARASSLGRDEVPLVATPRAEPPPSSFAQERLWVLDRLEGATPRYTIPGAVRLDGRLDPDALERALRALVERHEALRTTFAERNGRPFQMIAPVLELVPTWRDLRSLSAADREAELARRLGAEALRPFDLEGGPLIRAGVLQLGDEEHVLTLTLHHIVADGWSLDVLWRDLAELYAAEVQGRPAALEPLAVQYADYAVWQRAWLSGERLERQLAYWRERLAGAPTRLELPADRPRPSIQDYHGAAVPVRLGAELTRVLRRVGRENQATLHMVLLAAFQTLLHRYSGQEELLVGVPTAGRSRVELEELVGLFVNTLVLRANLGGDPTFVELLERTREASLDADAHQELPFERLVTELQLERDLSVNPLVQVLFTMQSLSRERSGLPGLAIEPVELAIATTKVDLTLTLQETEDGIVGSLEYDTALFDRQRIERLAGHLGVLLEGIAAEPGRRLSELPLLSEAERHLVVEAWNQTAMEYEPERTVPVRVEEQARRNPDALAVTAGVRRLRYGELNQRANQLAHELRARGVGPGGIVGVLAGRSPELVVALLGVMKAGAAYLPLDPAYPAERLAFMLDDAGAAALVTDGGLEALVPDDGRPLIRLDRDGPLLAGRPTGDLDPQVGAADLAYVIYTSGSTGRPKAVAIPHRGLANLVGWHVREYQVTPADRATQLAGLAFDASVWELWPYLSVGASVHFPDEATRADVAALVRWLAAEAITLTFLPTPLAELAVEEPWPTDGVLRALLTGGDRLHRAPGRALPFTLVNHYGPTENSVVSTAIPVPSGGDGDGAPPPIGRPIANTRTYVLDPQRRPTPIGVPGELYVGGESLARGYLHRPELTAELFVADPFASDPDGRLYRTGDLVRWRADGAIEFLGRIDEQVKVRGFRIEPGEIEAALLAHPGVAEAAVVARGDGAERRLAGYVVPTGAGATAADLRAFLSRRLPNYMVPSSFTPLEALPLTPNGKLDRRALPEPDAAARPEAGYVAPRTELEESIAAIWRDVLQVSRVGLDDNFFDLGGTSLLVMRVHTRLQELLKRELSIVELFQYPTIRALGEHLSGGTEVSTTTTEGRAARQRAALGRIRSGRQA